MNNILADVERCVLKSFRDTDALKQSIQQQCATLSRERSALQEAIHKLYLSTTTSVSDTPESTRFHFRCAPDERIEADQQKTDPSNDPSLFKTTAAASAAMRSIDHHGGGAPSSATQGTSDVPSATHHHHHHAPHMPTETMCFQCSATSIVTAQLPTPMMAQAADMERRSLACQQRWLIHAAKLQFAQEWARQVMPWFTVRVCQGFYVPLLGKLAALEVRLDRLKVRLSLDRPRYRVQTAHSEGAELQSGLPPATLLWERYVTTACARGEDAVHSSASDISTVARVTTDSDEAEEVVIVPSTAAVVPLSREVLRGTPRTLRHVFHVLFNGLAERRETTMKTRALMEERNENDCQQFVTAEGADTTSPRTTAFSIERPALCCCSTACSDDVCLACRVDKLLRQRSALFSRFDKSHSASQDGGRCVPSCGGATNNFSIVEPQFVHTASSLLFFIRHICVLHRAVNNKSPFPLFEQLVLLPFHLLQRALQEAGGCFCFTTESAHPRKRSRAGSAEMLADASTLSQILSPSADTAGNNGLTVIENLQLLPVSDIAEVTTLLQWWLSPSSWPCRSALARALRLARLYGAAPASETKSSGGVRERVVSVVEGALACDKRVCELRRVEVQVREQWQEIETRLLLTRPNETSA